MDGLLDAGHFRGSGTGEFKDRFLTRRGRLLGEKAHGDIFFEGDASLVWAGLAEDEGEEGGFARAVGADEADSVFAIYLEGNVAEEGTTRERFAKLREREHGERAGRS